MFGALAVIVVAVAVFTAVVTYRHRPATSYARAIDFEQLKGFVYVGAAALLLLAVAVVVLGVVNDGNGRAEVIAVVGLFAYAVYLAAAGAITYAMARHC